MLPARRNKIDISKLSPQEQELFAKYGTLPTHKSVLMKMQKERKYFDSGDYALSKAGVAPQSNVGTAIPNPENIPHASSPTTNGPQISVSPTNTSANASPVIKERSLSRRTTSGELEQAEAESSATEVIAAKQETSPPASTTTSPQVAPLSPLATVVTTATDEEASSGTKESITDIKDAM
ncbi:hypothetical protein AX16_008417 [Volvariella volvacea WC 439]|nr:hypothetical protein AX16_008417 [Volvariella volvacea WC 439]